MGGLAIVVPGHSRSGRVSARCLRLVDAAAALAEELRPRAVVLSGRGEAAQMASAWPGVDVEVVVEPHARVTAENATLTLPLLLEREVEDALVVCGRAHVPRVRFFFERLYASYGVRCTIRPVAATLNAAAVGRELAAAPLARRQRRAAVAALETALRG